MGKKEHLEEINKQIKVHLRSMFGNVIGSFLGFCFLVGGIYIKFKTLEYSEFEVIAFIFNLSTPASKIASILCGAGVILILISLFMYFGHKNKYEKLKLEEAKEK